MTIVKSSFQGMYVQVGTLIMRQVHGTAIGSQLSPVLRHICVARQEVIWQRIYGQWYSSHNVFLERYVDNRFVIFPSPSSGHPAPPLEALLQADFYGAPIVLAFTTRPLQKSGRSEDHALLGASPSSYQELGHGQHSPPSMRIRIGQYRWRWINFAASICPQATSQLTCNICFTYRRLQCESWVVFLLLPDVRVDPCVQKLVQTALYVLWTPTSCSHARSHDSASSSHVSERWGHDAAHSGDPEPR